MKQIVFNKTIFLFSMLSIFINKQIVLNRIASENINIINPFEESKYSYLDMFGFKKMSINDIPKKDLHNWMDTTKYVEYKDLSKKYIYRVESFHKTIIETDYKRTNIESIKVFVLRKSDSYMLQVIDIEYDGSSFPEQFTDPKDSRSSITGARYKSVAVDADYGDFVIDDFNFDGKEDFAVKIEVGGRLGPSYKFYISSKDSSFVENEFLSKQVQFMPIVDPVKKIIDLARIIDVSGSSFVERYRYDAIQNKYILILNKKYPGVKNPF
jgi:hypothetical protein